MKIRYVSVTLAVLIIIAISGFWLYIIASNTSCEPQYFPTTTAEVLPRPIDYSPLQVINGQYNFAKSVCDAGWVTGDWSQIPCSGNANDPYGMVIAIDQPDVEDNRIYANALWVRPSPEYCWGEGDLAPFKHRPYIEGLYDCIQLDSKDRFHAWVGCAQGNPSCDVTFRLTAYGRHITETNLGKWEEKYDGKVREIDLDLSRLAGNCVVFALEVESNSLNIEEANALWLVPEIVKGK